MGMVIWWSWICTVSCLVVGVGFALEDVGLKYLGRAITLVVAWVWLISIIGIFWQDGLYGFIALGTSLIYTWLARAICRFILRRMYRPAAVPPESVVTPR